jgi:hypothetical protein
MSSLFHFFGQQGDEHAGPLFWSESNPNGFPFRGAGAPLLGRDEIDEFVETHGDFHYGEFDLNVPEQCRQYCDIMTRAYNGWYAVQYVHREDSEGRRLRIVEWVQRYNELSPAARRRLMNSPAEGQVTNANTSSGWLRQTGG